MVKLLLDYLGSFLLIIIFSPIILLLVLLIQLNLGSPVFFTQLRPGQQGKIFKLYKFRTMIEKYDQNIKLLPDEMRLTKFGKFLRTTSLDELPEFINVLKGEMSLVGPRPLLEEYLPLYSKEQARRHEVKPGITGWAQVNGRNAITWEEKFELDVWYVDNLSLILDLKILFKTVFKVFQREGISSKNAATMPFFKGTKIE